jgi:hypothetical protein
MSRAVAGHARQAGSVTAELAVVLPVLVLVLAVVVGTGAIAASVPVVAEAAAAAARSLGRGEGETRAGAIARQVLPGAEIGFERSGDLRCARVSAPAAMLGVPVARIDERVCVPGDGR